MKTKLSNVPSQIFQAQKFVGRIISEKTLMEQGWKRMFQHTII